MPDFTAAYVIDVESSNKIAQALITGCTGGAVCAFEELRKVPLPNGFDSLAFDALIDWFTTEKRIVWPNACGFVDALPLDAARFLGESGIQISHVMDAHGAKKMWQQMVKHNCNADECHEGINNYVDCDVNHSFAAYVYLLAILGVAQMEPCGWIAIIGSSHAE